jgi:hypothetical protein
LLAIAVAAAIAAAMLLPSLGGSADAATSFRYLSGPLRVVKTETTADGEAIVLVQNASSSEKAATITVTDVNGNKLTSTPQHVVIPPKKTATFVTHCPSSPTPFLCVMNVQILTDSELVTPSVTYGTYEDEWLSVSGGGWNLLRE